MTYTPVTASLNAFVFDGTSQNPSGVVWDWLDLSGWFDSGDLRFATGEAGRGSVVTVDRRTGRTMTATVFCHSSHNGRQLDDLMYTAEKALKRAVAPAVNVNVTLKVNEPDVALQAAVRQAGPIRRRMWATRGGVEFQIPLLAPDYRRYSQTLHTQALTVGANTVTNLGDVVTPVLLTRTGATTNPSWQNTTVTDDPTLFYTGSFASSLDIDTDLETVIIGGTANQRSRLTTAQWWGLVSGANTVVASHASTITWRDAYS